MRHGSKPAMLPGLFAATVSLAAILAAQPPQVRFPDPDIGVSTLNARARAQRATVDQFKVTHDFQFIDRVKESGITFVNRVVDDAAIAYKPVHYDHGNGVAVADVDGDGLPDIYFTNQIGGNQLWKNLGGGRFADITKEAGVALAGRISVTASFADLDNDGDEDLVVTTVRGGNVLFENDGKGHFRDVSKASGIDHVGHSSGVVLFDFDRDGLVDLYVCNVGRYTTDERGTGGAFVGVTDGFSGHLHPDRSETPILYKNLGGLRFKDVTAAMGLGDVGWSGDASVADVNGDGFPDLYALNMQGSNHYFENRGGKRFVDRTAQVFPRTSWGAMGIKFFDYDNDGRPDLFVTDMHSDMSQAVGPDREKLKSQMAWTKDFLQGDGTKFIFGNSFFHNLGASKMEEMSDRLGVENYWPWGPSVGDVNADGWQDVFIASSMDYPHRYGINSLLLNNRGEKFLDSEFILGIEPRRGGRTHTPWFEADCAQPASASISACKGRSGKITVMAPLGSRSSVMFDIDQDGDLDIVTNDFNSEPQVLVSDLAQRHAVHWLGVSLVGTSSNRDGLGAVVRVSTGGRVLTQWNDGKSGYLSQSALPLYFGLGDVAGVDRVEVTWPSGRTQVVTTGLTSNTTLRLTEPAGLPPR
jgi:hypothetical protein